MSDVIQWCFVHHGTPTAMNSDGTTECYQHHGECDVADALVVRADQPVYRIDLWTRSQLILSSFAPHYNLTDLSGEGIDNATPEAIRRDAWEIIDALAKALDSPELQAREEWSASIDYEAAASELPYSLQMWQVKAAVDAAIGEEEQ